MHNPAARFRFDPAAGLTLVEMVIVIALLGVVLAVGGLALGGAFDIYRNTREAVDVDWQGRVALERIVRETREVRAASATDLAFAANPLTRLQFIGVDGGGVCFYVGGNTLYRSNDAPGTACGTTSPQPLADNIAAAGFAVNYYRRDGAAPVLVSDVYYIALSLQVNEGAISETYRVSVQPRRLP